MNKKEIRKEVTEKKKSLTEAQIVGWSEQLKDRFCSTSAYKNATVLYAYMSYNQEVRTNPIIEQAWADGKAVAVPKTFNKEYMEFCYITAFDELAEGYCNIPEPVTENIAHDKEVLILMPGLAFDRERNRTGYGGGFYDKYLSKNSDCKFTKIALGFPFQLYDHIEVEPHDEKMDMIITPEEIVDNQM